MSAASARAWPWMGLVLGAVNTLLVQLIVQRGLGLDLFGAVLWLVVPAGALLVSGAALAGFVVVARQRGYRADALDLAGLALVGLSVPVLGMVVAHAWTFWGVPAAWSGPQLQSQLVRAVEGAQSFVWVPDHGFYASPLGSFGWAVLVPKLAAVLAAVKIAHSAAGGGPGFARRGGFTAPR